MKPTEFIDCGRQVVVPNRVHAQGRNGIEVSAEANHVFTLEPNGRVSLVTMYQELEEALGRSSIDATECTAGAAPAEEVARGEPCRGLASSARSNCARLFQAPFG